MTTAGYQPSDRQLHDEIRQRLAQTQDIDVSQVKVAVLEGKVTLEGTVPEPAMQQAIEDLVEVCPGVQDVENKIRVQ
jgi:osmotically-inducible protein OsmY